MNQSSGLRCPRCEATVSDTQETCPNCMFRFRLSTSSLTHSARHGDSVHQAAALRDLNQRQNPSSLYGWAFLLGIFAIVVALMGVNGLMLKEAGAVCEGSRGFICRAARVFGGEQHVNTAYALIMFAFAIFFAAAAWKLNLKSKELLAAALTKDSKNE